MRIPTQLGGDAAHEAFCHGGCGMGPQRCIKGCGDLQRSPRFSCETASTNLPPFLVVHGFARRWTAERATQAIRRLITRRGVASRIGRLPARGAWCARLLRSVCLHRPTVLVHQHLDPALAAHPLRNIFDERLPAVGITSWQKETAAGKRNVSDTTCKFHYHPRCHGVEWSKRRAKEGARHAKVVDSNLRYHWGRVPHRAWHRVSLGE
jgi:hypothetical protein